MYSFLVLGLIPGTDIQITFEMWLQAAVILGSIIIAISLIRRYLLERRSGEKFNPLYPSA